MPTFNSTFTVNAPLEKVQSFHRDTNALKKLNPPPVLVQLHRVDPMAEGSVSEFTLWMGPLPLRWRAIHSLVSDHGFTDTQESGPMAHWQHTHRFEALDEKTTQVHDHVEYQYKPGWRGLITRFLFGPLPLKALFSYRKWATRRVIGA